MEALLLQAVKGGSNILSREEQAVDDISSEETDILDSDDIDERPKRKEADEAEPDYAWYNF